MNKEKYYFECILIDGTSLEFNKFCTSIEEFGRDKDMLVFKAKNYLNDNKLTIGIVPKNQIKHIINHYSEEEMNKVWSDSN